VIVLHLIVAVRLVILNNNLYIILIDKDMKPLNLDNKPCSPTSSNCVIWSGRNLPCINLCTGDTITDVIEKLATELCTIMDQLDITNYDLSCFNITACPPSSFSELLQFLIEQICANQGVSTTGKSLSSGCPDCVVTMAPCFITGTQTTMQLVDYVNLIANRICSISAAITDIQTQITNLDIRVTALEDAVPPTFTLPSIETNCLAPYMSGAISATIDLVLDTLLNDSTIGYCALINATGLPSELLSAVAGACITSTTPTLSKKPNPFGSVYPATWVTSPTTVADTINNIWIAICDIFSYLNEGFPTTVVVEGNGIDVTSNVVGDTTTYTVKSTYLETFTAATAITSTTQPANGDIPKQTPGSVKGVEDSQIMYRHNFISVNNVQVTAAGTNWVLNGAIPTCPFGTFNNETTGEFTITQPGTYLISGSVQFKSDNTSSAYWQTTGTGSIAVGIQSNGGNVFSGNYQTVTAAINKQVSITSSVTAYVGTTTIVRMGVLNLTDRNYDGRGYTSGDVVRFSITKLK
jgi:hypothetical protein